MRLLAAIFLIFGFPVVAQQILTDASASIGNFFVIRSVDCPATSTTIPRSFSIDHGRSSILLKQRPKPVIQVSVFLMPAKTQPSADERSSMTKWAMTAECSATTPALTTYPSMLASLAEDFTFNDPAFQIVSVTDRSGGAKLIVIAIDPHALSTSESVTRLNALAPSLQVHSFNQVDRAEASLSVDYKTAATFAINHYTEKVCTERRDCTTIAYWEKCKTVDECDEIPKVLQTLQTAGIQSDFELSGSSRPGVPDSVLQSLQEQLLSRLMLSLFVQTERIDYGNTTRIFLEDLNRSESGQYVEQN